MAKVIGGVTVVLYKHADFIHRQLYLRYATMDEVEVGSTRIRPLLERGREIGVEDPREAVRAELILDVTVTTISGVLADGAQLLRKDTGVIYTVVGSTELDAATVQPVVRAASKQGGGDGSGNIGNLSVGDALEFANPLANVARTATVASVLKAGVDAESTSAYRSRALKRTRAKPQGGAEADYREWAESADGVAAAYPYRGSPGEIDVYLAATTDVDADGIPTIAVLDAASSSIQFDANGSLRRRPAGALVNVYPVVRTAYDVEITGLDFDGDLAAVQSAVSAGVDEFLRTREPYIEGLSVGARVDLVTQGEIAGVAISIASSYGATIGAVGLKLNGSSITLAALAKGVLAKLNGANCTFL
jgi:hypothetical protein